MLVNSEKGVGIYEKGQFIFRSKIHLDINDISTKKTK